MCPVLRRLPVTPTADCSTRRRRKNRRQFFSLRKHYQCQLRVKTAPFYGWPTADDFTGFTAEECLLSKTHHDYMRHQLEFPLRKVTSFSPHNTQEYVFMVKEVPPNRAVRVLSLCDGEEHAHSLDDFM